MLPAKRIRKAKSKNSQEVLHRLEEYLEGGCDKPISILCGFWKDQQDAITYQELRQIVLDGTVSKEALKVWAQDYSVLVSKQLSSTWMDAAKAGAAGQPILGSPDFKFNSQTPGIFNWINRHGAEFVTNSTKEQKEAIAALLNKKMVDGHTVDELSKLIRPCIGLTKGQAEANAKFYDNMVAALTKEHPRMSKEAIKNKALDASMKYAERQHRYRAMTIAQTECAFAYNWGADEGVRQAMQKGLLGRCIKVWSTSNDNNVCSICSALEGVSVGMDDDFDFKGKILFEGQHMLPPAHPRCACAVEYVEVEPAIITDIPMINADIANKSSFGEYSTKEIEDMARQADGIVSKHISISSRWSGNIVVSDDGIKNVDGDVIYYGKMWNCDILTKHETALSVIMHEQIHARSISYYGENIYAQYKNIEEAAVQFITQEISLLEGIEIIESQYDELVEALKKIGHFISPYTSNYEFAKYMIEKPVIERMDWLSDRVYAILGENTTTTIAEYQEWADLLEILYTEG